MVASVNPPIRKQFILYTNALVVRLRTLRLKDEGSWDVELEWQVIDNDVKAGERPPKSVHAMPQHTTVFPRANSMVCQVAIPG